MNTVVEMLPVITLNKGVPVVTSMQVAEHFEKKHFHILRDIRRIIDDASDAEWVESNFGLSFKINELASGKQEPYYLITRDGFMILCMGFTGQKAMSMKIAFIKAFTAMEQEIAALRGMPGAEAFAGGMDEGWPELPPELGHIRPRDRREIMSLALQTARLGNVTGIEKIHTIFFNYCRMLGLGEAPASATGGRRAIASVAAFVDACCEKTTRQQCLLLKSLYGTYLVWCELEGHKPVDSGSFGKALPLAVPGLKISRPRINGQRPQAVHGLRINREARAI